MFKSAVVFRFSKPIELSSGEIETKLRERAFRPLLPVETSFFGFESPLGSEIENAPFVHIVDGRMLVCLRSAIKNINPAELRHRVDVRVKEIEEAEHRKVHRKERESIKDAVILAMIPDAFPEEKRHFAYITPRTGLIVVAAASVKAAELITSVLREVLGGLAVQSAVCASDLPMVMGAWIRDSVEMPSGLQIGDAVTLRGKDPREKRIVKLVNEDPQCEQSCEFLQAVYEVKSLHLQNKEELPGFDFILGADFSFSGIRPDAAFEQQAEFEGGTDGEPDDFAKFKVAQLDTQFVLFAGVFDRVFLSLVEAFGGYESGQEPLTWIPKIDLIDSLVASLDGWAIKKVGE